MKALFIFLVIYVLFVSGCGLNDNPPAYIQKIGIYDIDNNGFSDFYYVLCDSSGKTTTSEGSLDFVITAASSRFFIDPKLTTPSYWRDTLLSLSWDKVEKTYYYKTRIKGHRIIAGHLGPAITDYTYADEAEITLKFIKPNGQVLTKKETLIITEDEYGDDFYIKGDN